MKYSYFYIFILAGLLPGVLLPAAAESGPPPLIQLCMNAAAYRSAQPSENLRLDINDTKTVMAADIGARSGPYFTLGHSELIQRSVNKLSAKHDDITQHFISNNNGYEIRTQELRPVPISRSEEIADRLPGIMDRLYSEELTISDCLFLLENRHHYDFPNNYISHVERLTELETKVQTHFSRLCESNINPYATLFFEEQKIALSTTLENAKSLTNQRMNDLNDFAEIIRDICNEHNIQQKLQALQEEEEAQDAIRRVNELREREAQAAEQERQRAAQRAEQERQRAAQRAEQERQRAAQRAEQESRAARALLLRVAIPTTFLAVAGSAYLYKVQENKRHPVAQAAALFGPILYWSCSSIANLNHVTESPRSIIRWGFSGIFTNLPLLTDIFMTILESAD